MSINQKIKVLLYFQFILIGFTGLLWILVDFTFGQSVPLVIASVVWAAVLFCKMQILKHPNQHSLYFSRILCFYTFNTFGYLYFEEAVLPWVVQFSFAVFMIEVVVYSYRQAPNFFQIFVLVTNFIALATWSVFPQVGFGLIHLPQTIELVLKIQVILVWGIGLTLLLLQLRRTAHIVNEKDIAESNTQWYSDLFSILSHNIRTPLTTIYNLTQILHLKTEQGAELRLDPQQFKALSESSELTLKVVDEILKRDSVLKINGSVQALSDFMEPYQENHSELTFHATTWTKITQLSNKEQLSLGLTLDVLIDNALRLGSTQITFSSPKDGVLHLLDNGPGMNEEVRKYFGTPFNPYKSTDGSGLGTYFAGQLLARSGWEMKALACQEGALIEIRKRIV